MRIIAIEGLDKSGKHTTAMILKQFFESKNLSVRVGSLPNYDEPIGAIIGDWLKGKYEADSKTFELLQAADKQQYQARIEKWEEEGIDILIMDRYLHTMLAYGAYDNDRDWVKELSKYQREPDTVLYMDVEPQVSMHRKGKFGDNDRYESDVERLLFTKGEYERLLKDFKDTRLVDANNPPLLVKRDVIEIACRIYSDMTGKLIEGNDLSIGITKNEAETLKEYRKTEILA